MLLKCGKYELQIYELYNGYDIYKFKVRTLTHLKSVIFQYETSIITHLYLVTKNISYYQISAKFIKSEYWIYCKVLTPQSKYIYIYIYIYIRLDEVIVFILCLSIT